MVGLAVPARAPNCGWPCAAKPRRTSTVRRNTRWSGRLVNCCANCSDLHIAKACYKQPYLMWPNNQCSLHTSSGRDESLASFASRRVRGLNEPDPHWSLRAVLSTATALYSREDRRQAKLKPELKLARSPN